MAGDTRNIRINVDVDGDDRGAVKVTKGLDDAAKASDNLGDSFKNTGKEAKSLNAQIDTSRKRVAELRKELVAAGNDRGIRKALRGEESWLRELTKIQSSGGSMSVPSPSAGRMTGPAVLGVVGGLAPFIPVLGATIAGAVAGTIGTGGIAGGIAMAAKNEHVRAAARGFGASISDEFFSGGAQFTKPIAASLDILSRAFREMNLPETFGKMAPLVTVIATGFADLGRNVMPGLNKAFDRMGPFAEVAARGLGNTGKALGTFLDDVTSSEGTLKGLENFFITVNGLIVITGKTLNVLSDAFDFGTKQMAGFTSQLQALANATGNRALMVFFKNVNEGMHQLAFGTSFAMDRVIAKGAEFQVALGSSAMRGAIDNLRIGLGEAIGPANELASAIGRTRNQMLDLASAEINAEEAIDQFTAGVKEHGRSLDDDTEAGRENLRNIIEIARGAQEAAHQKFIETQSVEAARAKYDEYRAKLIQTAIDLGYTRKQAEDLANQFMGLSKLPPAVLKVIIDGAITAGGQAALRALDKARNAAGAVFSASVTNGGRGPQERALGGPVLAGVPYTINERGRETVTFPAGGVVHPAHLTPMGSNVVISMANADRVARAILASLQVQVQATAGGNVQQAFGRSRAVNA